jgi:hypothetical protein
MKDIHPALPDSMKLQEDGLLGEDGVVPGAELDLAARSVIDSTYIVDVPQDTTATAEGDSSYMISKDKELRLLKFVFPDSAVYDESTGKYVPKVPKYQVVDIRFNVEQDNYMWYLRNSLVLPDVRLAQMMQNGDDSSDGKGAKKEKKGIAGFFQNLFHKKKKSDSDSLDTEPAKPVEEFDYVDENEGATPAIDAKDKPKQKKAPFSFLKKKEKTPAAISGGGSLDKKDRKDKKKKNKKEKKPKDEVKPDEPKKEEDDGF